MSVPFEPQAEPSVDAPALRMTLTRRGSVAVERGRQLWAKRRFRWVVLALVELGVGWFVLWLTFLRGLPDANSLLRYEPPLPTNVRSIDGAPVYSYARERRVQLAYEEYPPMLVKAYLAAEDKNFFTHGGVDYLGIVRAAVQGIISAERPRGTSTITQQVAKNLLVGDEVTYARKLKEAILAYRIEDVLSKEQIVELYMNQIALGRNAFGVQSAARAYFGKDVGELVLHEMAYLAILPKGPSNYRPERFYDRAMGRRNWVLGQMLENDFITRAEHDDRAAS